MPALLRVGAYSALASDRAITFCALNRKRRSDVFIVWGKKIVRRELGYVADFCPLCRCKRTFTLSRVGSASHVYYLSFGEGELVGFERICAECRTGFNADPSAYAKLADDKLPLPQLQRLTYPNIDEALAQRLALEEKVRNTPALLSSDERLALIRAPFALLSPKVERRLASTHFDKPAWLALGAMVLLFLLLPSMLDAVWPSAGGPAMVFGLVAGLVLVGWQLALSGRRFVHGEVLPVLAQALRPLRPTDAELQAALSELKTLGHKMGAKLTLGDLRAAMSQTAAPMPRNEAEAAASRL